MFLSDKKNERLIKENIDSLTPFNKNPSSEIIDSFAVMSNTEALTALVMVSPLLLLASPSQRYVYGILSDSLLIVPDNPKKSKFNSVRIFWKDLDEYKLKVTYRGSKLKGFISFRYEVNGKKYKIEAVPVINKDKYDSIKGDIFDDFIKASQAKKLNAWGRPIE
jgi:hypothetical protein